MKLCRRLVLIAAIVTMSVGCASIPQTHYYVLEWPAGVESSSAATFSPSTRIGVRPFVVDSPYDQDRIVYRIGSDSVEIGFYAYHRWAVPLSRSLPSLVARALESAPGVVLIEPMRVDGDYDLLIDGRLSRLEEVDTASGPRVRVEIELSWRDAQGRLLGTRVGAAEAGANTREVAAVVASMAGTVAEAVREALAELPPIPDPETTDTGS
jgi:uncharacterized lipoprotein YmbA